jgi:hypothetical protein
MTRTLTACGLTAALLVIGELVYADVPTVADVVACNEEAREAVRGRTASPTAKDEARAADARKGGRNTTEGTDVTGTITQSADPQIQGMDAGGAKDAAYRAGFRVCMRRKGF